MTEKDFDQQVWRRFDTVTLDTGIETTIMNVCFSTRSVRIYIKDAPPEWIPFKRIESHKSRFGEGTDDAAIIQDLHNKVLKHQDEIERLRTERTELKEKAVTTLKTCLQPSTKWSKDLGRRNTKWNR